MATDLVAEWTDLVARCGGTENERVLLAYYLLCDRHGPESAEAELAWRQVEIRLDRCGSE